MKERIISRFISVIVLIGINSSHAAAQWSTSSNVDSALFVCYGFYPGIVTYEDGSSIVLGALSGYVYAQKLDEFGYKQWSYEGILAHRNDSSFIGAGLLPIEPWGGWVSDGDAGIILFWFDHRNSYVDEGGIRSNSIYAQRVDKNGNVRWQEGGVLIKGVETGLKHSAGIVDDGAGGCVIAWADDGFSYPGSPNLARLTAQRISPDAKKLWELLLDSSTQQQKFYYRKLARIQERVLAQFYGSSLKLIDTSGTILAPEHSVTFGAMTTADSTIYDAVNLGITRQSGDTTWYQTQLARYTKRFDTLYSFSVEEFAYGQFYSYATPIVPDGLGGLYSILAFASSDSTGTVWTSHTFVQHADASGSWAQPLLIDGGDRPFAARAPDGGLLTYNVGEETLVQKFDRFGKPLWGTGVRTLSSTANVENQLVSSDNNGGLVLTFWTTTGFGVYVQHSGRVGRLGVITTVQNTDILPLRFELEQNYPNPFNGITIIKFKVPKRSNVTLAVYDILGRKISELKNSTLPIGTYEFRFNADALSSGTYFYELKTGSFRQVKKMLLVR